MAYDGPYQRFAKLYMEGPESIRGNWAECAIEAGLGPIPENNRLANGAIRAYKADREALKALEEGVARAHSATEWKDLAAIARPVLGRIASGTLEATAAQVSALKEIVTRDEGKVTATKEQKAAPAGIVILPMLGEGAKSMICPRCGSAVSDKTRA